MHRYRYRFALAPGWLLLHVVTVALVATMVSLGLWQLAVSEDHDFTIRNFGYALQWWAFSVFTLIMWAKIMRDKMRHQGARDGVPGLTAPAADPEPVAYRRYVAPAPVPVEDELLSDYNAYLARLNSRNQT